VSFPGGSTSARMFRMPGEVKGLHFRERKRRIKNAVLNVKKEWKEWGRSETGRKERKKKKPTDSWWSLKDGLKDEETRVIAKIRLTSLP